MKYINRAGDIMQASWLTDNQLKLEGFNAAYTRISIVQGTDIIRWIDFSGGPMISLGDDLGCWFKELDGITIKSIESINGLIIIGV
jgi:hypothetical protein